MRIWKRRPRDAPRHLVPNGELFTCDAIALLSALRDAVADVIFLDPPFNLGKRYGSRAPRQDRRSPNEYEAYLERLLNESTRVLADGGSLYLYHIPEWAIRAAAKLMTTLTFRHWIAISMKNGFPTPGRLYPAHYALLYFTKGKPATFDRPKIPPARCRHCNEYTKDYGGYTRYITNGVNLSDFWEDTSPVRHRSRKKRAANELPPTIAERAVAISGRRHGLFIDPFMGTGASLVAAYQNGMRIVGADLEPSHASIVVKRLDLHRNGE